MTVESIAPTLLGVLLSVGVLSALAYQRRSLRKTWARGMAAYERGDTAELLKAFGYVVKKQPGWADARRMYARALTATGAVDQAEKELGFAMQLEPRNPDARVDLAIFLANIAPQREDEAIALLEEAVELKPELRMALATLQQFAGLRRNARFCVLAGLPEPVVTPARLN